MAKCNKLTPLPFKGLNFVVCPTQNGWLAAIWDFRYPALRVTFIICHLYAPYAICMYHLVNVDGTKLLALKMYVLQ